MSDKLHQETDHHKTITFIAAWKGYQMNLYKIKQAWVTKFVSVQYATPVISVK